jgi:D-glycero-D-manno-heptose 1,7-bisphosphate phosphatase
MLGQAVILAGGRGTRLGELTRSTPKPLLQVGGRPLLDYVVWNLKRHGVRRLLLSVGYLAEQFQSWYRDGSGHGVEVEYAVELEPLGTGGALLAALPRLDRRFLALNGDTLFDVNYPDLDKLCHERDALAGLALRQVADTDRYGGVELDALDRVKRFREKSAAGPGLVNGGVYVLSRPALDRFTKSPCSLENDVFPALAADGKLVGKACQGYFLDMGLPESYREAQERVPQWRRKPAAFLDRDGVLNEERNYVYRPQEFAWMPEAPEAVRWLNEAGYLVVVVTNQSGIARGYYGEDDFLRFTDWIQEQLQAQGAHIDATYYCPHHPTEGQGPYRRPCECRKPGPALLRQALAEWEIDLAGSFAVGDKESDLEAARAAGVAAVRFQGGSLLNCVRQAVGSGACSSRLPPHPHPVSPIAGARAEQTTASGHPDARQR